MTEAPNRSYSGINVSEESEVVLYVNTGAHCSLYGVTNVQTYIYYQRYGSDQRSLKAAVSTSQQWTCTVSD